MITKVTAYYILSERNLSYQETVRGRAAGIKFGTYCTSLERAEEECRARETATGVKHRVVPSEFNQFNPEE